MGVVYDLNELWSVYASAARIYKSQANQVRGPIDNSSPLDPLEGRSHELGLKGESFDGRLNGSLALYRVERVGEAVSDQGYVGVEIPSGLGCCYLNKGDVITQGVELEVNGELFSGVSLSASYAYNHNEDKQGAKQYNTATAPRHVLKLWGRYQFGGQWSRFAVGGGVTAQSKTWNQGYDAGFGGDYKVIQSGYSLWNGLAEYQFSERWRVAFNVNNIFDKKYYSAIDNNYYGNYYGTPRDYSFTLRGEF